jgi:DNA-binding winged helix-turn-helix (wHTH) protein
MAFYRFEEFEFDSVTGELRKPGRRVRLRPQPARALEHLLKRHGELVTRGELQQAIWADGTFVHFDHGLNSCIKQIRAALGDNRSMPRFVETLVRRGFRFLAPVRVVGPHAASIRRTRIRVLPIRLIGDDTPGAAGTAEGLAEEIMAQLTSASTPEVAVAARATAPGGAGDPELPADLLLAVTVRCAGTRLRVTARLIDSRTQCHVWAGQFDAPWSSPLDAEVSIAECIVREVLATVDRDRTDEHEAATYDVAGALHG